MDQRGTQDLDRPLTVAHGAMMRLLSQVGLRFLAKRSVLVCSLTCVAMLSSPAALAYRPFDSTDADVGDPGELKIEFSPLSYRRGGEGNILISPAAVVNYGFAPNWEVIVEGQGEHTRSRGQSTMVGNALMFKHLLRAGSLQGSSGLSVATEFGVELPGINAESGAGALLAGIVSQAGQWGAWHLTAEAVHTRDSNTEFALGTILEGPDRWALRPVAEISYAHELGEEEEAAFLAGAIWKFSDNLVFDAGIRRTILGDDRNTELRLGFSIAFAVRH